MSEHAAPSQTLRSYSMRSSHANCGAERRCRPPARLKPGTSLSEKACVEELCRISRLRIADALEFRCSELKPPLPSHESKTLFSITTSVGGPLPLYSVQREVEDRRSA